LTQLTVFNDTPNGQRGGIWNSHLASDGTFIYAAPGNGTWNAGPNWADSYLKLSPTSSSLSVADYFTPFNVATLTFYDRDLGSGTTLLPPLSSSHFPNIMIGAGKEGRIYVVNRDNMGRFNSSCDCQIIQSIPDAVGVPSTSNDLSRNFSTPLYWNGNVYFSGKGDPVKRFVLNTLTSKLSTTPADATVDVYSYPGSNPVVSANGGGSAILWAVERSTNILHAYDATKLSREFYNSNQNTTRDALGTAVKFAPPLVINGKVYIGTHDSLVAYGNF
jgi:hypothetical protein